MSSPVRNSKDGFSRGGAQMLVKVFEIKFLILNRMGLRPHQRHALVCEFCF